MKLNNRTFIKESVNEIYPEDYKEVGEYLKDVKYGQGYVTLEKVKMDIQNAPYNFTLADVLTAADRYGFKIEELPSGTALVQKGSQVNESLADVSKDDMGTTEKPVYADAVRKIKEDDKKRKEHTKIAEAPKHDERAKNPKMAFGAKKMYLSESLFDEYPDDEDEISDYVVVVYKDDSELFEYADEYQADAHFAELNEMTDEDLLSKGIIGAFRLMRDDEGKVFESDVRYTGGEDTSTKIDQTIAEYTRRANNDDSDDDFED